MILSPQSAVIRTPACGFFPGPLAAFAAGRAVPHEYAVFKIADLR
jgi:hypothetical protein